MEHEVKPLGTSFDGLGTGTGAFLDTGADGSNEFDQLVAGLAPDTPFHWRVRARYDLSMSPFQSNGPWVHVPLNGWNEAGLRTATGPVAVPDRGVGPAAAGIELRAGGPNPSRGSHEVILAMGRPARVEADVLDVSGRRVAVLVESGAYDRGFHRLAWDGRDRSGSPAGAGVYFIRVRSEGETRVRKAILLR
jgi:hypothetical protein